ncbi:MAG: PEGA domain-containing protein [Myxococcota bacterium]|nr:PEGA domain-containing protein [Myxococcota bacterium]
MKALLSACDSAALLVVAVLWFAGSAMAMNRVEDADTGFLDVSSEPSGAKILIDDADLGQTTPQHHLPVKIGHHRLTLVTNDGAHKLAVGFTIEAGKTKKLTLYLAK